MDNVGGTKNRIKNQNTQPFYKKAWFWIVIIVVIILIGAGSASNSNNTKDSSNNSSNSVNTATTDEQSAKKVAIADFSQMTDEQIKQWCNDNKLTCVISSDYSDTVPVGAMISQSVPAGNETPENSKITIVRSIGAEPSQEYKNALAKAKTYSDSMHMSKQGIYDQLTSQYGENFAPDAAQYAIDNLQADYNANALAKAKTYYTSMNMSKQAVYDQLVSQYGEKFTPEEAQYAVDNL